MQRTTNPLSRPTFRLPHHPQLRVVRLGAAILAAVLFGTLLPLTTHTPASAAPREWTNQNTGFVTRDATHLQVDGKRFRASGANIYWLGLDENVGGIDYPTYFRIKDTLDAAHRAGITVVRSHMGTSTSQDNANTLALMPTLGEYNDQAFATMDFAVAYAGTLGIRLILPLTDEWAYYHGGHRDFTAPIGLQPDDFYTDSRAISAYQDYVDHVIGHTNTLTGVPYSQDPTIMAWELGNELEGMTLPWINEQVAHIKQEAPWQLVAAGRRFDIDPDTLAAANLDIVDVHYYPPTAAKISADAKTVTAAGKVYIAGEYASTAATDDLLNAAAADSNVTGMFVWSLFGHDDRSGLVAHDDGFTLHIPGGTAQEQTRADAIEQYARSIGVTIPTTPLDAPLITAITRTNGVSTVTWRGTAGATDYVVERQIPGKAWTAVHDGTLGASAGTVTDFTSPAGASYRVRAINPSGAAPAISDVVTPAGGDVLVDPLQNWRLTSSHTDTAVQADPEGGFVTAVGGGSGTVTWKQNGLTRAAFQTDDTAALRVETSTDGSTWAAADTTIGADGTVTADSLTGDYVRVVVTGTAHLTRATLRSAVNDPTTEPGAFSLQSPTVGTHDVTAVPTFSWTPAADAAYYRFSITDEDGTTIAHTDGLTATTTRPDVDLQPGVTYRWSVTAVNGVGSTSSTPASASFSTRALPTQPLVVEDFEEYADDAELNATYLRNTGGGAITATLTPNPDTGSQAGRFSYDLAGPGYAGVVRTLATPQDWWGYSGLELSLQAPAGDDVTLQIVAGGSYFETTVPVQEAGWQRVSVPFDQFKPPAWAGDATLDPSNVTQLAFYLGGDGAGELTVDDVSTTVAPAGTDPGEPGSPTPTIPPAAGTPTTPGSPNGGASPSPSAVTPSATENAGTDDPSGGLAFTGASFSGALVLAALGAVLLGGVILLITRRRRTRTAAGRVHRR